MQTTIISNTNHKIVNRKSQTNRSTSTHSYHPPRTKCAFYQHDFVIIIIIIHRLYMLSPESTCSMCVYCVCSECEVFFCFVFVSVYKRPQTVRATMKRLKSLYCDFIYVVRSVNIIIAVLRVQILCQRHLLKRLNMECG